MIIKIADKEYTLKYNNKSFFKIEKELNIGVIKLFQTPSELEKMNTIFVIVHSGIVEDVSFDDFCEDADLNELTKILPDVLSKVTEAFSTGSKKK